MHTAFIAALAAVAVVSANNSAAQAPEELDEMVVTATRRAEPLADVTAAVIVIDRASIERSLALDIGDLLAHSAGLEIARNGGPGQAASLFTRGTNSDHTLVMVDGVRINPGTLGGAAIHNIAPDQVERIEVVKGPRSTLWGSDAIGGVVNIFTRASTARGLGVSLGGGSFGTRTLQLDGGTRLAERGAIGFAVGTTDSDGFPTLRASNVDRGFRERNANLYGEWRASDAVQFAASAWHAAGTSEYLDFFATPVAQDFRNQALRFEAKVRGGADSQYRIALLGMQDAIEQLDYDDFVDTRRVSLDVQGDWQLTDRIHLTAGGVFNREHTESLSFGSRFDERTNVTQAYAQSEYQSSRHRVAVAVGATDHPAFGHHLTWNADYAVSLPHGLSLALMAGTAFKAPDATDRFGFGANPDLEPERSRQFEIGLRHRIDARQSWHLSAYRNDIDDLINFVVTDFTTFDGRNENIDRARIEGIELGYRLQGSHWQLELGASLSDPRDRTTDEVLLRRARQVLTLSAVRQIGRWEINAEVQSVGARFDFGFPARARLAPYALLDIGASVALTPDWKLQLRLDNALDENYELASGYRTARRGFMLATRYRFR